jgi:hypothetical protein
MFLGQAITEKAVDRCEHLSATGTGLEPWADTPTFGRAQPGGRGPDPGADAGVEGPGDAVVDDLRPAGRPTRGPVGEAERAAGDGAVHVADGAEDQVVGTVTG